MFSLSASFPFSQFTDKREAIMRHFSAHISVNGAGEPGGTHAAHAYEHSILRLLHRIHRSQTGASLLFEINRRAHKKMVIMPYHSTTDPNNAYAQADDIEQATRKGFIVRDGGNGAVLTDAQHHTWHGKGGGSDTIVRFSEGTWTKYCNTHKAGHKTGAKPDEVLFHEMVHATREMRGVFDPEPLGHMYDTDEEFYAILISNIYASETHRPIDLRSDHHGFTPLSPTQDTSAHFLPHKSMKDYRYRLIDTFVREEHGMAHALRHIPAHFNPIRRYFQLQDMQQPAHA